MCSINKSYLHQKETDDRILLVMIMETIFKYLSLFDADGR